MSRLAPAWIKLPATLLSIRPRLALPTVRLTVSPTIWPLWLFKASLLFAVSVNASVACNNPFSLLIISFDWVSSVSCLAEIVPDWLLILSAAIVVIPLASMPVCLATFCALFVLVFWLFRVPLALMLSVWSALVWAIKPPSLLISALLLSDIAPPDSTPSLLLIAPVAWTLSWLLAAITPWLLTPWLVVIAWSPAALIWPPVWLSMLVALMVRFCFMAAIWAAFESLPACKTMSLSLAITALVLLSKALVASISATPFAMTVAPSLLASCSLRTVRLLPLWI